MNLPIKSSSTTADCVFFKRYQFSKDTFANILTSGLLGEQYIGLMPGGDSQMLANGEELKKTQSAVVLEDLIGKFIYNKAESSEPAK